MKVRDGFVSNSSSSSFVLIADKKHFYDILEKYEDIKPIIENLKEGKFVEELNFLGKDIVVLAEWMDAGGGGPLADFEEDNPDLPDKIWDRFYNFKEKLEKDKSKCYIKELDW
jgi:hypothetical protein